MLISVGYSGFYLKEAIVSTILAVSSSPNEAGWLGEEKKLNEKAKLE